MTDNEAIERLLVLFNEYLRVAIDHLDHRTTKSSAEGFDGFVETLQIRFLFPNLPNKAVEHLLDLRLRQWRYNSARAADQGGVRAAHQVEQSEGDYARLSDELRALVTERALTPVERKLFEMLYLHP